MPCVQASKIEIPKGKGKTFYVRLVDENGRPVDISDFTVAECIFKKDDGTDLVKTSPLATPENEIQKLEFSDVPDAGSFKVKVGDRITGEIPFSADAAAVQAAVSGLDVATGAIVTGSFVSGFQVEFDGDSEYRPFDLIEIASNTLEKSSVDVDITVSRIQSGVAETGIDIQEPIVGELKIVLDATDTAQLAEGIQDLDVYVRIGSVDLAISMIREILDVRPTSMV